MIKIPRIALFPPFESDSESVEALFRRHEYSIRRIKSVDEMEALRLEEQAQFDVAVVPLRMEGGASGAGMCLQLKSHEHLSAVPILGLAPLRDLAFIQSFYGAGADAVAVAPHDSDLIFLQIGALAREKRAFEEQLRIRTESQGLRSSTLGALDATREGLLIYDARDTLLYANKSSHLLLALPEKSALSAQRCFDQFKPYLHLASKAAGGVTQASLIRGNGQSFSATLRISGIFDKGNVRIGAAVAISDRAEIEQMGSRLMQAERLTSLCLFGIAGCLELQGNLNAPLLKSIEDRIQSGASSVELGGFLTTMLEILDGVIDPQVTVKVVAPSKLQLAVKPAHLLALIGHMLFFAANYVGKGGFVTIEATPDDKNALIKISADSTKPIVFIPEDPLSNMLQGKLDQGAPDQGKLSIGLIAAQEVAGMYGAILEYQDSPTQVKIRVRVPLNSLGSL